MIILGVDPGSLRTGYGAIETDGRRHRLLEMGILAPSARLELPVALARDPCRPGQGHRPPAPRRPGRGGRLPRRKNARSALVLGHVRGVVLLAGADAGLPVSAFPPATVKVQVTGSGARRSRRWP